MANKPKEKENKPKPKKKQSGNKGTKRKNPDRDISNRTASRGMQCTGCMEIYNGTAIPKNFYKHYADMYRNTFESRMPFCKECVLKLFKKHLLANEDVKVALKLTMQELNYYWSENAYRGAVKRSKDSTTNAPMIVYYLSQTLILKGKTFNTYLLESPSEQLSIKEKVALKVEEKQQALQTKQEKLKENKEFMQELKIKWRNRNEEDCLILEDFYHEYELTYSTAKPTERNLYKNLAKIQLRADKCMEEGDTKGYKDLMDLSSKLHNDGNIKPIQLDGKKDGKSLDKYGVWIETIEETDPCEYFKDKPLYKDFDELKKYFEKWILRPIKNIFNITDDMLEDEYDLSVENNKDVDLEEVSEDE